MNLLTLIFSVFTLLTPCVVPNFDCSQGLTLTTVRPDSCIQSNCTLLYEYPAGHSYVDVLYNNSFSTSQDFYQNHTLVGSCPKDLYCMQRIPLDRNLGLTTNITLHHESLEEVEPSETLEEGEETDDEEYSQHQLIFRR